MAQFRHNQNQLLSRLLSRLSVSLLIAAAGCRSTAVVPMHRPTVVSHSTYAEPVEPAESESLEVPAVPETTADDAIAVLRSAGGKLRPDEQGNIVEIDLSFSSVTDQQLELIQWFPAIAEIDLTGTDIHDDSLSSLSRLPNLRAVKLKGTQISPDGLQSLTGLSELILIDASNTAVADESLLLASQWSSLRYLSLNDTAVTDSGLRNLATLRNLKGLSLINTSVTESGVNELKRSLPECVIVAKSVQENPQSNNSGSIPQLPDLGPLNSSSDGVALNDQLQQLISIAGSQPHLAVHLSKVYSSREQWEETAQILATANVVDPGNDQINLALGEAYARLGRSNDAILHLEQVIGATEARYVVGMIVYEDTLKSCERYFGEVAAADPDLKAAQQRHQRIQSELAALSAASQSNPRKDAGDAGLEIIPIQSATHSRVVE